MEYKKRMLSIDLKFNIAILSVEQCKVLVLMKLIKLSKKNKLKLYQPDSNIFVKYNKIHVIREAEILVFDHSQSLLYNDDAHIHGYGIKKQEIVVRGTLTGYVEKNN
jgi:hypothetical protein